MTYSLFDLYLRNGAPPLRVAAQEALHHHITALSVGIHRVLSVMSYFIYTISNKINYKNQKI